MQHADAKVPQADPAVLADAAEAVVSAVAPPRVEGERRHPRVVPLAARDEGRLGRVPDGDEVVLAACEDVLGVGGPADTG